MKISLQSILPGRIVAALLLFIPSTLLGWQQRVHYTMEISLDPTTHSYAGVQRLVYNNNSPDTLHEVYYHLFFEAFKPQSMMDIRDRNLPGSRLGINQLPPEFQGEVAVEMLTQEGTPIAWNVEETILRAPLHHAIPPGGSTVLEMRWKTRIPILTRRAGWMSREGVEYSMAQWYPKLAAYDRNGWHTDEYVGREFYGVFGTYDVAITLPARYVVGATGTVINPSEVGCGYELGAVDTTIYPPGTPGTGLKTWRFHAENVHDFAWVADPEYVHQITSWNGVAIHVLVKRSHLTLWRNVPFWTAALLDYFSSRFGRYDWPQFTVAMAGDGGMEYPQLIMITGNRTQASLAGVIAHELGHQWYYGMLGSNETQEAWLDEGFAQFLTNEANRHVFNILGRANPYSGLDRIVYPWDSTRWKEVEGFYELAIAGYDEALDTYHDHFREGATSGLVYSKGEAVLDMLQYMFGRDLFDDAMRRYLEQWKFRHPSTRDFEHVMERTTGMRLDWFFNQWINSTKRLDYALDGIRSEPTDGGYRTTLELSNREEAIMPLDITLTYDDGTMATAWVPTEPWEKPGADFQLPRWTWVRPTYSASFLTPKRVVRARIDSSMQLPDIDRTNNTAATGLFASLLPGADAAFYRRWDLNRPLDRYTIRLRPTLWYSQADGAQLGLVADGGYAFERYNAKAGASYNIASRRVDYDIRYNTRNDALGRLTRFSFLATNADGIQRWGAEVEKTIRPYYYHTATTHLVSLRTEREVLVGPNYPNVIAPWQEGGYTTIGLGYDFSTTLSSPYRRLQGSARFDASVASPSQFTQWQIAGQYLENRDGVTVTADLFFGASVGAPPAQRLFNVAGARSREMHLNEIQRLAMNIRPEFAARNHLVLPTQGFLLSLAGAGEDLRFAHNLLNVRINIGDLNPFARLFNIPILNRIDLKLYGAAGTFFDGDLALKGFSHPLYEAGAVASVDVLNTFLPRVLIDMLDSPNPLILSLHLPLYADLQSIDRGLRYRFALGVSI